MPTRWSLFRRKSTLYDSLGLALRGISVRGVDIPEPFEVDEAVEA